MIIRNTNIAHRRTPLLVQIHRPLSLISTRIVNTKLPCIVNPEPLSTLYVRRGTTEETGTTFPHNSPVIEGRRKSLHRKMRLTIGGFLVETISDDGGSGFADDTKDVRVGRNFRLFVCAYLIRLPRSLETSNTNHHVADEDPNILIAR